MKLSTPVKRINIGLPVPIPRFVWRQTDSHTVKMHTFNERIIKGFSLISSSFTKINPSLLPRSRTIDQNVKQKKQNALGTWRIHLIRNSTSNKTYYKDLWSIGIWNASYNCYIGNIVQSLTDIDIIRKNMLRSTPDGCNRCCAASGTKVQNVTTNKELTIIKNEPKSWKFSNRNLRKGPYTAQRILHVVFICNT